MHSDAFDVIPFEDIKGEWKKLGAGSFGNVYQGRYLGIDVAIKEVLPSKDYDVGKYFEREWRLMKESRHPNIVLFLGLSRAPEPDNRIFIISEFIENGNLRHYIYDKTRPMPWRLRLSFATDITRALAYLHARKCIHRDLKGENLLVTSNGRLKITDFGFARIAARSADESKRLTFCGTDSYMSPEIMLGDEFDLPTDVFSLGIIFCEIISRTLADDHHFKRAAPDFGIHTDEVHSLASSGCPAEFIDLAVDCCATAAADRPTTRDILERLRLIEMQVLARQDEDSHVGSIKFLTGGKRPGPAPRIPSFGVGVGKDIRSSAMSTDESDDELMEAIEGLSQASDSAWTEDGNEPLLDRGEADYSTTVIKSHSSKHTEIPSLSSVLTIRMSDGQSTPNEGMPGMASSNPSTIMAEANGSDLLGPGSAMSIDSFDSYHTAVSSEISSAYATEGGSTIRSLHGNYVAPLVHRFTLLKPGAKPSGASTPKRHSSSAESSWNPLDIIFSSGLLTAKCDVCAKRLGWKPVLECDDCGLKTHVKCGEIAPMDCGIRPRQVSVIEGQKLNKEKTKLR
ncbi:kinase-like protein [Cylindrobasidium torrendii FP15055 ss-10]|uniref:Kinase-like protein n=1 Tax=Cylindrobasidium torrendii FP15055 ss-10 TaxID=1314674 RepID=A0A0D7AV84_9AGAR|nr:kinase-like protein [Cylindrobasidium torrendii FP15055 ss-10]